MIAAICSVVVLIASVVLVQREAKRLKEKSDVVIGKFGKIAVPIFFAVLAFLIIDAMLLAVFVGVSVETETTAEMLSTQNIVALQDNTGIDGQFFLGCGSVEDDYYYAMYVEAEYGDQYMTVNAENYRHPVYVKATAEGETPHIDQYGVVERKIYKGGNPLLVSVFAYWQFHQYEAGDVISTYICSPAVFVENNAYFDNFRTEIHVPDGSIVQNYTIDLND